MKVYNIPGESSGEMDCGSPSGSEIKGRDAENKFVEATAELVCEILNIGWNDKDYSFL